MPNKGDQIQYSVGVDDLLICFKSKKETSMTPPEYEKEVYRLPSVKKMGVKGNGKETAIWASSKLFAKVSQETTHTLSLETVGIPINILDKMQGFEKKQNVSFAKAYAREFPEFALGIIARRSDDVRDAIWYPNCSLNPATTSEYDTAEEAFKEMPDKIELAGLSLRNNGIIYSHFNSARDNGISLDDFVRTPIFDPSQIRANTPVSGVSMDKDSLEMKTSETHTLIATVAPADATDKSGVWSSESATIAVVDEHGTVTAKSTGTTTVSFTTNDGQFRAECKVTVA